VAAGQFFAEPGAGQGRVLAAELVDQAQDRGVREAGRARHTGIVTENSGKLHCLCAAGAAKRDWI